MTAQLEKIREEVDRIDRDMVRLLAERMDAIRDIGAYKRDNKRAPIMDAPRERRVADLWSKESQAHGLSPYFASRILREILTWSRRDQAAALDRSEVTSTAKTCRVAFQGTSSSYSDLAIKKLFAARKPDQPITRLGRRTFKAALSALLEGEADYAMLPVENTIAGTINEVYTLLSEHPVTIVDEEAWEVEHTLVGLPGTRLEDVRTVRSQAVALQQCRKFLDDLGSVAEATIDTATAAHELKAEGDPSIAAICSEEAARELGLDVIARDVSDVRQNLTRFVLIAREAEKFDERVPARTSLVLSVNHRHGALASCLQSLSDRGCNLTKLESRPQPDSPWEYLFYVDAEGRADSGPLAEALSEIQPLTNQLQVLGTYPRRVGAAAEAPSTSPAPAPKPTVPAEPASPPSCTPDPQLKHVARKGEERSTVQVGPVAFGGSRFVLIAGPCAVESRSQIFDAAAMVKDRGGAILRGGAFKPRTSPYSFQGLGQPGVEILAEAGRAFELPVVTEVVRLEDVDGVAARADMLQVGARNMQNFGLLSKLGTVDRPILLKRGMSATIKELLLAAEYIMAGGNQRVVLCERGIRTFETATRNTLDVSAIPVLKDRTHLPVIADPSHAAGRRDLVSPLALAAAAAGADGLIVECHPRPEEAQCDKEQALTGDDIGQLNASLRPILEASGRHLGAAPLHPPADDGGPCFHGC